MGIETSDGSQREAKKAYWGIKWSDRSEITSDRMIVDFIELNSDARLTRHDWLQQLFDSTPQETVPKVEIARAMVNRLNQLAQAEQRDPELEEATAEMGMRNTATINGEGIPTFNLHVRSSKVYTRGLAHDSENLRTYGPPKLSHVTGIANMPGLLTLGENIGYEDAENASAWFFTFRTDEIGYDIPLSSITDVQDFKRPFSVPVVESPVDPELLFVTWKDIGAVA